jgi:hypothetical protein
MDFEWFLWKIHAILIGKAPLTTHSFLPTMSQSSSSCTRLFFQPRMVCFPNRTWIISQPKNGVRWMGDLIDDRRPAIRERKRAMWRRRDSNKPWLTQPNVHPTESYINFGAFKNLSVTNVVLHHGICYFYPRRATYPCHMPIPNPVLGFHNPNLEFSTIPHHIVSAQKQNMIARLEWGIPGHISREDNHSRWIIRVGRVVMDHESPSVQMDVLKTRIVYRCTYNIAI